MPRYDDRYGDRDRYGTTTRLYVGHLSSRTRSRDLEHIFSRYGRVRDVDMKHDYAFVEFSDPRDADDARYSLNGRDIDGSRLIVEFAKGVPRGPGGTREYMGRGPPPGSGRCFNCGLDGHWARDCKSGDWKNKCYRCGERGHIERNCTNSPKKLSRNARGRSYSRSPVRSRSRSPRRGRSRSRSFSRSRSYSRSRSPQKRERRTDRVKESRSPRYSSRSPDLKNSPPPKARKRSPSPEDASPFERGSLSPVMDKIVTEQDGSDYGESPRARSPRSLSPVSPTRGSPIADRDASPLEANGGANGMSRSPSPRERSPIDDVDDEKPRSFRGSESP
ncbi:hypothetical protein AgCh_006733 [Apium graveolens]